MYRSPGSNSLKSVEYYETILSKLNQVKHVYISTDQNFDLLKMETHIQTTHLFNTFMEYSFLPVISKPTRITENTSTLIDNVYVNNISDENTIQSGILLEDISDHCPIFCTVTLKDHSLRQCNSTSKLIERRSLNDASIETTKRYLDQVNWDYLNDMDVNEACISFNNKINDILDITAHKKENKYFT